MGNSCRLKEDAHSSTSTLLHMFGGSFYKFLRSAPECLDAMKAQYRQVHKKDIALEVYSPREMKRMTRIMLAGTLLCRAVGSFGNAGVAPFASERKPSRTIKKLARVEEKTCKNKLASLAKRKPSRRIKKK